MRISDWSSDVCSSVLLLQAAGGGRDRRDHLQPAAARPLQTRPQPRAVSAFHRPDREGDGRGAFERADRLPAGAPWRHANLVCAERSEEHTSELQSLMRISYAVFCLKKKNTQKH